jgi:hypothetical protein
VAVDFVLGLVFDDFGSNSRDTLTTDEVREFLVIEGDLGCIDAATNGKVVFVLRGTGEDTAKTVAATKMFAFTDVSRAGATSLICADVAFFGGMLLVQLQAFYVFVQIGGSLRINAVVIVDRCVKLGLVDLGVLVLGCLVDLHCEHPTPPAQ